MEKETQVEGQREVTIAVPLDLLESLVENTIELRGERDWWKDEPRLNYQRDYQQYCDDIKRGQDLIDLHTRLR